MTSLFPYQSMTEIVQGVALCVIGNRGTVVGGEFILPNGVSVGVGLTVFGEDIAVVIICKEGFNTVFAFAEKLSKVIIGIFNSSLNGVNDLCYAAFIVIGVVNRPFVGENNRFNKLCDGGGRFLIPFELYHTIYSLSREIWKIYEKSAPQGDRSLRAGQINKEKDQGTQIQNQEKQNKMQLFKGDK